MPKLKTHSGMSKRIKVSGTGKLLRRKAFRNHNMSYKPADVKRTYTREFEVAKGDESNIKRMLGKTR